MSTLHLLSHSPFTDSRLASCLRLLGPDDGVLLTGDAVYAGADSQVGAPLQQAATRLYALGEDVQARGLTPGTGVTVIDYPEFVELTLAYDKVNSWL